MRAVICGVALLRLALFPAFAEEVHRHAHAQHEAALDTAVHPYATDAALRAGMLRVKGLLDAPRPGDARAAGLLADAIHAEVKRLFAECRLEADADAALHGVLALLLQGADGLRKDAADDAAWQSLRQSLVLYPQRFDDPGFGVRR